MKKITLLATTSLIISISAISQKNMSTQNFADLSVGFGSSQGAIAAGYFHNWNFGAKKKLFIGTGVRFTSFYGKNINFTSAPASLAGDAKKEDTLIAPKPSINSLNLLINLGYNLNSKIQIGFNIDAIGFSFGPEGSPNFKSNGVISSTKAKPTSFNALLVGNNDKGSLNSEFYLRYKVSDKIGIKGAYQYLFNELTTNTKIQTTPAQNDRFRNKASLINIGVSYHF